MSESLHNGNNKTKTKRILIAGVGNLWRHDDGVGVIVARKLQSELTAKAKPQQKAASTESTMDAAFFLEIGIDGFALLDVLPLYSMVIIIDAVNMRSSPGTLRIFTPQEAKLTICSDALSTHGFGLAEVLRMAEQLAVHTEIRIVGIEPKEIEFGEGLSAEVAAAAEQAVMEIKKMLGSK